MFSFLYTTDVTYEGTMGSKYKCLQHSCLHTNVYNTEDLSIDFVLTWWLMASKPGKLIFLIHGGTLLSIYISNMGVMEVSLSAKNITYALFRASNQPGTHMFNARKKTQIRLLYMDGEVVQQHHL